MAVENCLGLSLVHHKLYSQVFDFEYFSDPWICFRKVLGLFDHPAAEVVKMSLSSEGHAPTRNP
jgi:hypothetical protein